MTEGGGKGEKNKTQVIILPKGENETQVIITGDPEEVAKIKKKLTEKVELLYSLLIRKKKKK